MPGIASVMAAMMCELNDGSMWRKMIRRSPRAGEPGRQHEILLAQRQEAAAHDPRQAGPADHERMSVIAK